ncbi:MAG: hypothetical protein J6W10_07400, partial [Kiritimatiellae bacterium]|nr:hypothetical protein [Kiritimatiellia bacterium]
MTNICIAALASVIAFSAFADTPAETVKEARAKFEASYLDVFKGRKAKPAETVAEELNYEKAKGERQWRFMLQVSTDDRVRFIDAKFSSGKFISGNLCVFGLKSAKLDAEDFALLKRDFVMAVSKIGSEPSSPVVIHRSRKNRLKRTASWKEVRNFRLNPISDLWGAFPSVIKQRGVKVDSLACTVDYESKDGVKGSLGKFVNASKKSSYNEAALHKAIVKIHADAGSDTTKINMRNAV